MSGDFECPNYYALSARFFEDNSTMKSQVPSISLLPLVASSGVLSVVVFNRLN